MREELRDIASGFRGDRILVAEDDPINQRVIQLMLQRAGYSVDVVWNGWQAVAAFHAQRYDLVLMDCRMPEMDGLEAARHIRKLEEHRPAIIAVTAYMKTGYREQCFESGMDDYLSKPYRWQQLLQVVRKHLERSQQPAPSGSLVTDSVTDVR
jgi:CheY-like chemotaxis protein